MTPQEHETATVLAEAEAIRTGAATPPPADAAPITEGGPGPGTAQGPPSADFQQLGELAVLCTDHLFGLLFGPGGAMQGELRSQTVTAWGRVFAQYLPALQTMGPLGALGACYAVHAVGCVGGTLWTPAPLPDSSGGAAQAKPRS